MIREIEMQKVQKVHSQPGDGTRYDFLVRLDGLLFWFYGDEDSTIKYPKYLRADQIGDINTSGMNDKLIEKAAWHGCNPWTLAECIRVMNVIISGKATEIAE